MQQYNEIPLSERLRMLARSDCPLGDEERQMLRDAAAALEDGELNRMMECYGPYFSEVSLPPRYQRRFVGRTERWIWILCAALLTAATLYAVYPLFVDVFALVKP